MDIAQRRITKRYSNGEVTVVWQPHLCAHSTICFRGLPEVFDPRVRPWVRIGGASTARIVEQVKQCPSGALSYVTDRPAAAAAATAAAAADELRIEVRPNGPLVLQGRCTIQRPDGTRDERDGKTTLCRCGGSANKPYCDGSHRTNGFVG
jgi:uncharacterized Fe-S cluster protein YjdI